MAKRERVQGLLRYGESLTRLYLSGLQGPGVKERLKRIIEEIARVDGVTLRMAARVLWDRVHREPYQASGS